MHKLLLVTIFLLPYCFAMEQKQATSILEKIHFSKQPQKEVLPLTQLCCKSILYYLCKNPQALVKDTFVDRRNITPVLDKLPIHCIEQLLHAIQPIEHPKYKYTNDIGYRHLIRKDPQHNLIIESLHDSYSIPNKEEYNLCCLSKDENYIISNCGASRNFRIFDLKSQTESTIEEVIDDSTFTHWHQDDKNIVFAIKDQQPYTVSIASKTKRKFHLTTPRLNLGVIGYVKPLELLILKDLYQQYIICSTNTYTELYTFKLPNFQFISRIEYEPQSQAATLYVKDGINQTTLLYQLQNPPQLLRDIKQNIHTNIFSHRALRITTLLNENYIDMNCRNIKTNNILNYKVSYPTPSGGLYTALMRFDKNLIGFTDPNRTLYTLDIGTAFKLKQYLQTKISY